MEMTQPLTKKENDFQFVINNRMCMKLRMKTNPFFYHGFKKIYPKLMWKWSN